MPTPLGVVARGLAAGAAGTALMDAYQKLRARLGDGSPDAGAEQPPGSWAEAPAPAQIGQRVAEGVFHVDVPLRRAPELTQAVHWAYGTGWGAAYALAHASGSRSGLADGLGFGSLVFGAAYVVLPAARVYDPIWRYDARTIANDLAQHLVYGLGVAAAYAVLDRRG
ncbi:MAG: hypothetical protein R3C15_02725 [Thermoleophilia bacterium]